jgi:hypothetical protein
VVVRCADNEWLCPAGVDGGTSCSVGGICGVASILKPPMAAAPPVQKPMLRILGQAVVYVSQHSDYSKCAAVRPLDAVCDPVRCPLSHPTPLALLVWEQCEHLLYSVCLMVTALHSEPFCLQAPM